MLSIILWSGGFPDTENVNINKTETDGKMGVNFLGLKIHLQPLL